MENKNKSDNNPFLGVPPAHHSEKVKIPPPVISSLFPCAPRLKSSNPPSNPTNSKQNSHHKKGIPTKSIKFPQSSCIFGDFAVKYRLVGIGFTVPDKIPTVKNFL